jgi:hypothetical protein
MSKAKPITMLCIYRPKKGKKKQLLSLIRKHWPTLSRAGLVSKEPPRLWRARDKRSGQDFFVEVFQWKDGKASGIAHRTPGVMAVWGPMEPLLEDLQLSVIEPVGTPITRR